jgi:signal transduction histidine kinase
MKVVPKTPDLLPTLQSFPDFANIDADSLKWMIDRSEYRFYMDGEHIFQPGEPIDHMMVIMEGKYFVRLVREGEMKELGIWEKGAVTGVLPFSRMKETRAYGTAQGDVYVLVLHKKYFTEMVNVDYHLTQNLVAIMSNRIREFTSLRFQDEKLMSLGRLSAGLAHELNNPASAMKRSAEELYQKVHSTPDKFKKIMTMRVSPEDTDRINSIMYRKLQQESYPDLSLMEREEKMDDLIDWLDENEVPQAEDLADTFVDYDFKTEDLEEIRSLLRESDLAGVLAWIESTLSLERLVGEIQESADRISTLVKSVKAYSHMDRADAREEIDLHNGLRNTLIMLKHKFKHGHIDLHKDWDLQLPHIIAHASSLNQVWTNLIVNALDAMPDGGKLTIRTHRDRDFLCVDVEDTGVGIPEEDLTRIFDPFFTTKPMGEGTGMGLDIVKKILDRHKATIRVQSHPGQTIFTVCFPVAQVAVPL